MIIQDTKMFHNTRYRIGCSIGITEFLLNVILYLNQIIKSIV